MDLREVLRLHGRWLRCEEGGTRADLTRADLTGADLTDAVLTGAVLTDAVLTGAVLTGAVLTDGLRELVRVPNLHVKTLESLERGGELDMDVWHRNDAACDTAHCRAGWYIHHAGPAGAVLEALIGPAAAGAIIATASCPYLERVPDFYCSNAAALADIRRCAEIELSAAAAQPAEA